MEQIAIGGAGEIGGLAAHALARRNVADVHLIDDNGRAAEGKALDIMQAAPMEGFSARVSGDAEPSRAAGASIVIVADRFGGDEWHGEPGLMLIRRLREMDRHVRIVCAGPLQRDLIDRGVREVAMASFGLIGSAPEALAAGARAMVALEANVSPREVSLSLLGIPPHHIVIPWEDATIAGFSVVRLLDGAAQRRVEARVAALWPPGPYACASAAVKVIEILLGRSRQLASCFVAADGAGVRTRAAALPVRVDSTGAIEVVLPTLSVHERVLLDNAMML
jgi:malate dehydrogenase